MFTVEDYIEILAGIQTSESKFELISSDYNLITSLGRQTFKGIAFTDRQFELAKIKLNDYKDQFETNGYNDIEQSFDNLRMPVRELDRSKYIKHQDDKIVIRFIFNKKLIQYIEEIKRIVPGHEYSSVTKIHSFPITEKSIYEVIKTFKDKNFVVQDELLEYYKQVEHMADNKNNYIPGIYSLKLENLNNKAIDFMMSSHGEPTIDNLAIYNDRRDLYGLHHFDDEDLQVSLSKLTTLSQKIVKRKSQQILINPQEHNVDRLAESILELNRMPLLVVLNEKDPLDGLYQMSQAFKGILFNSSTVLFRLENTEYGQEFNSFIKDNDLNISLDNNPKVVYISNNKLPKPMISSQFQPSTAVLIGSHVPGTKVDTYLNRLDLVIHYDQQASMVYSYRGTNRRNIEKI